MIMKKIFIPGLPVQEGNITPWGTHREGERLDDWRRAIAFGYRGLGGECYLSGPVTVFAKFGMKPPKGKLPNDRQGYPTVRPDLEKLARAVMDALEGHAYKNDAQVVDQVISKRYSERPGVMIAVAPGALEGGAFLCS
jgi:Holliday junction resolvase RusA-like endonuclease